MSMRAVRAVGFVIWTIVLICCSALASEFLRAVGVRVVLPWTDLPLLVGVEVTADLDVALASGTLFITFDGRSLITLSADIQVSEESKTGAGYLRLTTGMFYFDPADLLPTPMFGAGFSWRVVPFEPLAVSFAGEFIYPLAFPLPLFSISGGWSLE